MSFWRSWTISLLCLCLPLSAERVGAFEWHCDVGETPRQGAARYESGEYRITGGGATRASPAM
jgi:hypothetical protein